jgi:hypothetical protein
MRQPVRKKEPQEAAQLRAPQVHFLALTVSALPPASPVFFLP